MARLFHLLIAVVVLINSISPIACQYEPNWQSLDARPLPQWYDNAKFGIFIHWGVFAVPSYVSEWFWWYWQGDSPRLDVVEFMKQNYPPDFTYPEFASQFQTAFFDPNKWADLFQASGAKYVVLTSKHHEGFTLWPSSVSWNWNAMDVGPKRDLVGELSAAIRNRTDIHFGLYHSLFEWFNPIYLNDKDAGYSSRIFPQYKTIPELYEIVNTYQPEVIWSDGDDDGNDDYWGSKEFLTWLYNESPVKDTVVVNDRWGYNDSCHHGGFYTCNDRYSPGTLQPRKWENCMTIDKNSWGYRRNAKLSDYMTIEELISTLASTVSCGGNLLMNIGPTKDGLIIPIFEERLRQMGQWLSINGEAIYESIAWTNQNDTITPDIWYTAKLAADQSVSVYAIVLKWPTGNVLQLGAPITTASTSVSLLGYDEPLDWALSGSVIAVQFPDLVPGELPWAWVLKLEGLQ